MPRAREQTQEVAALGLAAEAALAHSKVQIGLEFFKHGDYQKASDTLVELLQVTDTTDLWNDWAAAEATCGRTDEAEAGFRRALALDANNGEASANLGVLLVSLDRAGEAIPLLAQAAGRVDERKRVKVVQLLAACSHKVSSEAVNQAASAFRDLATTLNVNQRQRSVPATQIELPKPNLLLFEGTSHCNMHCFFCPSDDTARKKQHISHEEAVKFLEAAPELASNGKILFNVLGEPLLNPRLFDYIELCEKLGIRAFLVTNVTLLNDKNLRRIFSHPNIYLFLSVHTLTDASFADRGYPKIKSFAE